MILRKLRYKILVLVLDLSVATAILLATWIIEYKRPQAGIRVQAAQTKEVQYSDGGPRNEIGNADLTKTKHTGLQAGVYHENEKKNGQP